MSVIIEHRQRPLGLRPLGTAFVKYGLGYGAAAAMILSYSVNKSIVWMLIDGWFSWVYVVFFALFRP